MSTTNVPDYIQKLSEKDWHQLINAASEKTKSEGKRHSLGGLEWVGEISLAHLETVFNFQTYLCPDEWCFVYKIDGMEARTALSGYAIATSGSAYNDHFYWPDWAQTEPKNLNDLLPREVRREAYYFLANEVVTGCLNCREDLPEWVEGAMKDLDDFCEGNFDQLIRRLSVVANNATREEADRLYELEEKLRSVRSEHGAKFPVKKSSSG